jgi:hypothetical protein
MYSWFLIIFVSTLRDSTWLQGIGVRCFPLAVHSRFRGSLEHFILNFFWELPEQCTIYFRRLFAYTIYKFSSTTTCTTLKSKTFRSLLLSLGSVLDLLNNLFFEGDVIRLKRDSICNFWRLSEDDISNFLKAISDWCL